MGRTFPASVAVLACLLAVSPRPSCAEDAPPEITVRLFRVKTAPFLKGLSDDGRLSGRLVFDRKGVADLEALLKASGGECVATAKASQAQTIALEDKHADSIVRDVDLEIDEDGVRGEPIRGQLQWGLSLSASGVERDDAGNLRMTLSGSFCLPRPDRRQVKTEGGTIDLPGVTTLGGTFPLLLPPGGATIVGASDLEDPSHTVVLMVATKGDEEIQGKGIGVGMWGFSFTWLDLPGKETDAILKGSTRPPLISGEQVARARKGKVRLWAFAPTSSPSFDLSVSSQQAFVKDYDEEIAGGRTAWDTVIDTYGESVRIELKEGKLSLKAEVVERPMAEKKVANGKKTVLDPVTLSAGLESDISEAVGFDWLLAVPNPLGVSYGALLVSPRTQATR